MWSRFVAPPLFCFFSLVLFGCHSAKEPPENTAAPKVDGDKITIAADSPQKSALAIEVAQPVKKSVIRVTGRLAWYEDATVRIFASVAGRVDKICAQIGQKAAVDDTLATIASPDFGQAQADASRALADVKLSERTLIRLRDLFAHGAAAQKDVEAAEDDFSAKRSENERAQARLRLYGATAGSVDGLYSLKSPVGGTVVDMTINPGQEVRPDQMLANAPNLFAPLFIVSDPKRLAVQLDVTELEVGSLKVGQPLHVRSRAFPDKVFNGRLELISDSLDPQTRMVKVRGIVDNSEGLLKAEMYVSVEVEDGGSRAGDQSAPVEIPVNAVFSKDNQHFVFIEKSPGEYQRRAVEVGKEHDGRMSIADGLTAGERIVSEGCLLLQSMTEAAKE